VTDAKVGIATAAIRRKTAICFLMVLEF